MRRRRQRPTSVEALAGTDLHQKIALTWREGEEEVEEHREHDDLRNSLSHRAELCTSHSNQCCCKDGHFRKPMASQYRRLLVCLHTYCWLQSRSHQPYEVGPAVVESHLDNYPDYTQSHPRNQPMDARSFRRHPGHNLADCEGGLDHCDFSCCRRGYRCDRVDNLSTNDHVSRRHSSQYDFPFPGQCEADLWTAVRSSACLVRREKKRMRPKGCAHEKKKGSYRLKQVQSIWPLITERSKITLGAKSRMIAAGVTSLSHCPGFLQDWQPYK